jgi:TetR/AcrR family transcriptional repressor of nem operon
VGPFFLAARSKSDLLEAIVESELNRSIELFSNKTLEQSITAIEGYLSQAHVEHPESGCMVPSLAPEIARSNEATQLKFEQGMLGLKNQIWHLVNDDDKAWSIVVQLIGAVMVARALPKDQTRNALLSAVTNQVKAMLEVGTETPTT